MPAGNWMPPLVLAEDATATKYSIAIASGSNGELHVVFARVRQGFSPPEDRAVSYMKSADGGISWSVPIDIYSIPDPYLGASDTRLLLGSNEEVYVTWTIWDESGNGKYVSFVRSLDSGESWEQPIKLSETVGDEYERDWTQLALLRENELVAMWEGGFRAYRQAMYSYDNGVTWSEPIDTFPWLIGENGFVEFAYDSNNSLHLFVAQRVREGYIERGNRGGLWHSVWEGGTRWREPTLAGGIKPMVNPKVVIVGGNKVVAAWTSNTHTEVKVMTGIINNAPPLQPYIWPAPTKEISFTSTPIIPTVTSTPEIIGTPTPDLTLIVGFDNPNRLANPGQFILIGVLPSLAAVLIFGVLFRRHQRS
jgi:hypothetical protein